MDWIKDNYPDLIANPLVRSLIIILGSIIIAKITDLVFTVIIKRLTSKTRTELDDKIVVLFHKPIFYSLLYLLAFLWQSKPPIFQNILTLH